MDIRRGASSRPTASAIAATDYFITINNKATHTHITHKNLTKLSCWWSGVVLAHVPPLPLGLGRVCPQHKIVWLGWIPHAIPGPFEMERNSLFNGAGTAHSSYEYGGEPAPL